MFTARRQQNRAFGKKHSYMSRRNIIAALFVVAVILALFASFGDQSGEIGSLFPSKAVNHKKFVSIIVPWRMQYTGRKMLEQYESLKDLAGLQHVREVEVVISPYYSLDLTELKADAVADSLPIKIIKKKGQKEGQVFTSKDTRADVRSYAELVNRGTRLASSQADYFLVLSPTNVPDIPLATFVDLMVGNATAHDAGITGCTTLVNEDVMDASELHEEKTKAKTKAPKTEAPPTPDPEAAEQEGLELPDVPPEEDVTPAPTKSKKTPAPTKKFSLSTSTDATRYILDHGMKIEMGRFMDRMVPFVSRRLAGFEMRDPRMVITESVDMVSPYCFLISQELFKRAEGLRDDDMPSSVDQIAMGQIDVSMVDLAVSRLVVQLDETQRLMGSLNVQRLRAAPPSWKTAFRDTFQVLQEARKQIDATMGTAFWDVEKKFEKRVHIPSVVAEWQTKMRELSSTTDVAECLGTFAKMMEVSEGLIRRATFAHHETVREDTPIWDLAIRVRKNYNKKVIVTSNTVNFDAAGYPARVQAYFKRQPHPLVQASMAAPKLLMERWGKELRRMHPFYQYDSAPVRVFWDAFCCGCCGFANEIVHFLYPLQDRYIVNLVPAPSCFCPGFPSSVEQTLHRMHTQKEQFPMEFLADDEIVVWVSHTDPMSFKNAVFDKRRPEYVVGRSMYEFTNIDANWVEAANHDCDEIWVPAKFVQYVFESSGVDLDKLVIVPEAIDTNFFNPAAHDALPLPPAGPVSGKWRHWCNWPNTTMKRTSNHYKFFTNFKWEPRKGWDIMFRAYFDAFTKHDDVSLYVLTHYWFSGPPETYGDKHNVTMFLTEMTEALGIDNFDDLPHFCFLTADMSEKNIAEVYKSVDAFIMPTRGEGWGLPTIQAMSMALPTISTNWGGQQEFMTTETSFMIPVDAVEEIPFDSVYRWKLGKKWATPSYEATRDYMRIVYDKPVQAAAVGARARQHVVDNFSEEAVADVVDKRLQQIRQKVLIARGKGKHVDRGDVPQPVADDAEAN